MGESDLDRMAREGRLVIQAGARINGVARRADMTRMTQPSGAQRKAERRRKAKAARRARRG